MGQGLQLTIIFTPLHNVPKKTIIFTQKHSPQHLKMWASILELTLFFGNIEWNLRMSSIFAKTIALLWHIPKHYPRKIFSFLFFPSFTICVVITTCQALGGELFSNSHGPLKTCPHHSLVCSK
jgi:hypothetical protein